MYWAILAAPCPENTKCQATAPRGGGQTDRTQQWCIVCGERGNDGVGRGSGAGGCATPKSCRAERADRAGCAGGARKHEAD